jgi:hypothetical protein
MEARYLYHASIRGESRMSRSQLGRRKYNVRNHQLRYKERTAPETSIITLLPTFYLHLLPFLGVLFAGGVHSKTPRAGDTTDGNTTVGNWDYIPGAYIIEYEQGHVS